MTTQQLHNLENYTLRIQQRQRVVKAVINYPMKYLIPLLFLSSCTIAHHPVAGTYASLGGDAKGVQFTQDSFGIAETNNSAAFKEAKKAVATYFMIQGAIDLANTAAGVEKTTVNADVSKAKISADKAVQLETIKAETAVAELAVP